MLRMLLFRTADESCCGMIDTIILFAIGSDSKLHMHLRVLVDKCMYEYA